MSAGYIIMPSVTVILAMWCGWAFGQTVQNWIGWVVFAFAAAALISSMWSMMKAAYSQGKIHEIDRRLAERAEIVCGNLSN